MNSTDLHRDKLIHLGQRIDALEHEIEQLSRGFAAELRALSPFDAERVLDELGWATFPSAMRSSGAEARA